MSRLLAVAAALLVIGCVPTPARAAPVVDATAGVQALAGPAGSIDLPVLKKKKKKSSSSEDASLNDPGTVKRGKENVEITATVAKADRTCELKIKYADGNTDSPDAVSADGNKTCVFKFDVADDRSAVGDAKAELTVKDSKGRKVASDSRTFTVK